MTAILSLSSLDLAFGALGLYFLKRILSAQRRRAPFPPGPKGVPLLGNVLDMPTEQEWKTFDTWSHLYGDIVGLNVLGQPMVILNSAAQAYATLDKKSSVYSDRPVLTMASVLVGWKDTLVLTPYNARFRELRRMLFGSMGTKAGVRRRFAELQELETHRFLRRVLHRPEGFAGAIRKTAGAIILRISHGYQVLETDDPMVSLVDIATEQFSEATQPGAFLVDVVPWLRHVPAWFPGAGFQAKAKSWAKTLQKMVDVPHEYVKAQMAAGTAVPSFTSVHLEREDESKEDLIKWAAGSLYGGGADTTVSATNSFFLAMTLHPHAQRAAQAEIDRVVGTERLPTLADRDSLPFVEAVVREVFRWMPVVPLGAPHRLTEDDLHDGYLLPKGTVVIANIWKFLHDPATYESPLEFKPERFLPREGKLPEEDPRTMVFGFGRRICPGQHLADNSVWLSVACSLAVFDIAKAKDASGQEITPVAEQMSGTISHPKPFACSIRPRSAKAEALINSVEFAPSA